MWLDNDIITSEHSAMICVSSVTQNDKNCVLQATGETPMFLSASVFLAIRHAISAARKQNNMPDDFTLNAPATTQRIRELCGLDILSVIQ